MLARLGVLGNMDCKVLRNGFIQGSPQWAECDGCHLQRTISRRLANCVPIRWSFGHKSLQLMFC